MFASMFMGLVLTLTVWLMTWSAICGFFVALNILVGIKRLRLTGEYGRMAGIALDRRRLQDFDRRFLFWWTMFSLGIGVENFLLVAKTTEPADWTLASGVTIGFTVAFASRNAGRLKLFLAQVFSMCAPMIVAYAVFPVKNGVVYAGLLCGLLVVAILLGFSAHDQIVELYRANLKTRQMALNDMLTGLMNRFAFTEALEREIERCGLGSREAFSLIVVDLDRFKEINDMLGHNAGDAVIVEMAARLRRVIDGDDVVARLGGDEFVVLSRERRREWPQEASALAERIVVALREPAVIDASSIPISASLGVAHYPDHGVAATELMKKVDIALYEAKREGRNRAAIFDSSMQARFNEERVMELEIETAIARDEFEPWFQPIGNIETGQIVGYEALARWPHPVRGMISPGKFIPSAEQTGAIVHIGEQILQKACAAAAAWPDPIYVSVNLSPVQFRQTSRLVASVREALARSGLPPRRLTLEITESLMMEDTAETRAAIAEFDQMGISVSLDDFGAGYSSLSYIHSYPFSKIKIDKTFIDNIESERESIAIVSAVRVLAEKLDMELIAEGVETLRQHLALRQLGVTRAQGYYYGKPVPQAEAAVAVRHLAAG
ncbi:EAL domain-containing protein [Rhodoblastus acidophilus]|uniref:putative bifunctional diguanylate cyclase/phosphodiesterase n=1 Tax=Candidatus Rhodoblastus alkanivorans TaxID=2954117 RepID=UPI001FAA39FB|nr:EAL domain-containing protein [Candidatus Rhodoblastus alkanivorans]MDI4641416.1 EAL domain-containing protein [Rhodoblastus acidophilus]